MAHLSSEKLITLFSLLAPGYIDEDAEHDAPDHADILALAAGGNPPNAVSDEDAEVDLIRTREGARCGERGSHAVPIRRMDVSGQVFEADKLADRNAPQAVAALVHGQLVAVDVP